MLTVRLLAIDLTRSRLARGRRQAGEYYGVFGHCSGPTTGNSFTLNYSNGDNAAIAQTVALNVKILATDYITTSGTSFVPSSTTYVADDSSGQSFVVVGSGTYNFIGGDGNITAWEGPGGNASVAGGNGNDLFGFNAGSSYVVAAGNGDDTFVANGSGTIYTGTGQNIIFSDPAGPNGNFIYSHGQDTISAGTGPTTVATFGYAPLILGGTGNLVVYGNTAVDETVAAGSANTIFSATSGTYFMGTGNQNVFIGSANSSSVVIGSTGSETVFGGPNSTEQVWANSSSLVFAGASGDSATIVGGTSQATLFGAAGSNQTFLGTSGAFYAAGGGNETLNASGSSGTGNLIFAGQSSLGGSPNTLLMAGSGDDTMVAGSGNDTMTGGAGSDNFQFTKGFVGGTDIINDFANNDLVALFGYGTAAGANALATATVSAGSTTIALSDNTKITFSGVTSTSNIHIVST